MSEAVSPGPKPLGRIGAAAARRIALAASGFGAPRPPRAGARQLGLMLARLGLVQIDSVNVLARAHYMPGFSRLGAYEPALLDAAAYRGRSRSLFEYWGHEASLIRVELQPQLRWRMARARDGLGIYTGLARFGRENRPFIEGVLARIAREGRAAARDLGAESGEKGAGGWWGWSPAKRALEWLFWAGELTTAERRGFERVYDLPERALPRAVLDAPTPDPAEAHRALVRVAARALGIATERDLRDYFRLDPADSRAAVAALAEAGELLPVAVEGWDAPAFLHPEARRPRRVDARALVSPFDPLVWDRARAERLFGFRYRIEIYTPAHKREHGYYVLPFLMGDRFAARLDLKADRPGGRLLVHALHLEPGHDPVATRAAIEAELALVASWLGLRSIEHRA